MICKAWEMPARIFAMLVEIDRILKDNEIESAMRNGNDELY